MRITSRDVAANEDKIKRAVLNCRDWVARQFREPTNRMIAEVMVNYDALHIGGYGDEMVALRAMRNPIDFVEDILDERH